MPPCSRAWCAALPAAAKASTRPATPIGRSAPSAARTWISVPGPARVSGFPTKRPRTTSLSVTPNCSNFESVGRVGGPAEIALLREPAQHRQRAGQHRPHLERQALPRELLALVHMQLAGPIEDLAEIQPHQRVR